MYNSPPSRLAEVKQQILKRFTQIDTSALSDAHADIVQSVMRSLVVPPALSRDLPSDDEYRKVLGILNRTSERASIDASSSHNKRNPERFGTVEIGLVLQALNEFPDAGKEGEMKKRMQGVLRSLAGGDMKAWQKLQNTTDPSEIALYGFLKDALLRAKQSGSSRLEEQAQKRSRKRFWDGGVSI